MDRHKEEEVSHISHQIHELYQRGDKFRISHGSTNSTRPSTTKRATNIVNIDHLSNVIDVDKAAKTVTVEPNVPMNRLVEATLALGLIPPVVIEFPGITVRGRYSGTSGESSSFKHGYFDQTINWVEMILATGEVVKCSRAKRPDLFHGAAGAVGSLGVTTLAKIQLLNVKKYAEVTYHPVTSVADAARKCELFVSDQYLDYIDGILYSTKQGAIITGRMTDSPDDGLTIQTFSNAEDPWYFLHVRDRISKTTGPISESAFEYWPFPFNDWTRWWLDDFCHTRMLYTALHASGQSKTYIVQDLALPFSTVTDFIHYTTEKFNI
ncbi:FAD-binding domain-containing protein [Bimuria novae-zelandiae CBS 107.79]|uniref:Delta(24)-sterol reductase n=1 Tax=Bimuria novae-zelandiae CBS 107.79 TaxID=1447943 RepID=A0A6A5UY46_9PLEO|nr:FAD-binding domain-containing protein [Bimuria novae-zelandiae CBS 107.79]